VIYEEVSVLRRRDSGGGGKVQALRRVSNRRGIEAAETRRGYKMVLQDVFGCDFITADRAFGAANSMVSSEIQHNNESGRIDINNRTDVGVWHNNDRVI
jgi:hypothetical protein